MPKLSDLALRTDMQLGPMLVSPSRRLLEGPGGSFYLEPLIMQVFLLLLDAHGKVVSRTELFDRCWGGVIVGNDSLNRAIASLRRAAAQVAPGLFEIETIPRTGYRITGKILRHLRELEAGESSDQPRRISRRVLVAGGAGAVAFLAGAGTWWTKERRPDARFEALMARGEDALRLDEPGAARYFERAAELEPGNAKALGLLSYALASGGGGGPASVSGRTALASERAARAALEIDSSEPNALLARSFVHSGMLDWHAREREYRRILAIDPTNTMVMRSLGSLLHSVGRCSDALAVVERALALEPLTPDHQARKALRLWALGRMAEADRVSDRAMGFWPSHYLVRMARFMIYAYSGRTRAALAMIEDEEANPIMLSATAASVWRSSLTALETQTSSAIAAARIANVEGARSTPPIAAWAILTLSALGELDSAFEVANGFLLSRGSVIVRPRPQPNPPRVSAAGWRNTFGIFTPPTKAMRLDPRFGRLAEELGLTDYWRRRGIGPDAFLFEA